MKNSAIKKIVIIDDDKLYLEVLKHDFKVLKNVEVKTYSSTKDCFDDMVAEPDLIILDYYLDSDDPAFISGYQTLNKFKEYFNNPNVIMMSSSFTEDLLTGLYYENLQHKSIDFTSKNIANSDVLLKIVENYLDC